MKQEQAVALIDFKRTKQIIDKAHWFYDIPTGYSYFEALENNYDIDEVINWLDSLTYGLTFLQEMYEENKVEIDDYLETLEDAGDSVEDSDYRIKLFLNYFSNVIARTKIRTQKRDLQVPEWVEFTLNI